MAERERQQPTLSAEEPGSGGGTEPLETERVLVTGSSGFIGRALCDALQQRGYTVIKLVRTKPKAVINHCYWNLEDGVINCPGLEGLAAVFHLAGENIAGRWTKAKKQRISDSRLLGTSLLCRTLASISRPPAVLIGASATGFYGNRGDELLSEQAGPGRGFLSELCRKWEAATLPAAQAGMRVVNTRIGVVLSEQGGALKQMLPAFKLGIGGMLGTGKQYLPWIGLGDLVQAMIHCAFNTELRGPVNLSAPQPATNADFTRLLAEALGRPVGPTAPAWSLKLALGEMADETVLASQRAVPEKLLQSGFRFAHSELESLLNEIFADTG
jgi:uncharacterized protein (TIGR01777 family)